MITLLKTGKILKQLFYLGILDLIFIDFSFSVLYCEKIVRYSERMINNDDMILKFLKNYSLEPEYNLCF